MCACDRDGQIDPLSAVEAGDYQAALDYWHSNESELESQNYIGVMHYMGLGMERRDPTTASEWFRRAAREGYAPAQFNLGMMYRSGDGVEQDLYKSFLWIYAASTQKHPNTDIYLESLSGQVGANIIGRIKQEAEPFIPSDD